MKLHTSIKPKGGNYRVQVGLGVPAGEDPADAMNLEEKRAVEILGEPVIECGGEFEGADDLAFELEENDRFFPSQFPVVQLFQIDGDADAEAKAVAFADTIKTRIDTAMTALRTAAADHTSQSSIADIDTSPA